MTIGAVQGLIKQPLKVSPAGLHFKQSPLKAFINANFYKPTPDALDGFVAIKNKGNGDLFEKINPFKSIIANYAKANNIRTNFTLTKDKKGLDVITMAFNTLNKKGNTVSPFGIVGTGFDASVSKRKAMDKVHDLLAVAAEPKSDGTPLFIEDKLNPIHISEKSNLRSKIRKHGLMK